MICARPTLSTLAWASGRVLMSHPAIVTRDVLTIEEIDLFEAVDLWATKACERQGLVVDGVLKRRVLGDTLVRALRFPTMKLEDFTSAVLDSKILTQDGIVTIIKCLSSVSRSPVDFPEMKRSGFKGKIQRCCRFNSFIAETFYCSKRCEYVLNFSVDKNILLLGVRFFGDRGYSLRIDLVIEEIKKQQPIVFKTGQSNAGRYEGCEVLFDRSVFLMKDCTYSIQAKKNGSSWTSAEGGIGPLTCSSVTFTFDKDGPQEFPELLFTL